MSKTEFAVVLEFLNDNVSKGPPLSEDEIRRYNSLKKSLRIADKLMQDTSITGEIVRDAILKEIEL